MLRPYQSDCIQAILAKLDRHHSTLAVLATGLGKTVIGASVIRELSSLSRGRVLWLAHRDELLAQAADAIRHWAGVDVAVEKASRYADHHGFSVSPVVVASVQTMRMPRRLKRFEQEKFGLIITDEAHHATARSYRSVYDYFREGNPAIRHLGITATPRRSDNIALGKIFDTVAYEYGIEAAVSDGWLVPVSQAIVRVADLRLEDVHVVAGDFKRGELEDELSRTAVLHQMAAPSLEMIGDAQALFFCAGVKQAAAMRDVLNGYRPGCAGFVSGETEKEERNRLVKDYKEKRLQVLVNCGVFTEGFDAAATAFVVMGRPTKSLPLYIQMLGRATRPLPGTVDGISDGAMRRAAIGASAKPSATVIDFVGNAHRHGSSATVNAVDVLGGNYPAEVRDYAGEALSESNGPRAVTDQLDRAEAELSLMSEEVDRKASIIVKADYDVDYIGRSPSVQRHHASGPAGEPATEKQIWKLVSLGVKRYDAERVTKRQAMGWIGRLLAGG